MGAVKNLIVRVGADLSELEQKLQSSSKKLKKLGSELKSVGTTLTAGITAPVLAVGAASFKLASDLNESMNKVDVAFKGNASEVEKWSKTTLKSYGIAQGTALDMAANFGDMGTSMGLSTDQAAKMSMSMTGLAGDLASFKNISIDQAQTALTGVFTGETESLKQLGIVMTQANLQQFAYSQGINKNIQDMTQAEQTQLRYAYVMSVTGNAQGDFARTSDGTANSMRIFQESLKEAGAAIGTQLLPVITPIIQKLTEWIQAFGNLDSKTKTIIIVLAGLAAIVGPLILMAGMLATAVAAISLPMLAAAAAIALPIAAGIALYLAFKKLDEFMPQLKQNVTNTFNAIKSSIADKINAAKEAVGNAINAIKSFFSFKFSWPSLPLPHFSVSPAGWKIGDLLKGSIPSLGVNWYAKGGVFNGPSVIGVGEAGKEAVIPLDRLDAMMNSSAAIGGTANVIVELDGYTIARAIGQPLTDLIRVKTGMKL